MSYHKYLYSGPVTELGKVIVRKWTAITYAPSEIKARNNLAYRFKKENCKTRNTRIGLPGEIVILNDSHQDDGEQSFFECLADLFK